jgi:hypothetical protein
MLSLVRDLPCGVIRSWASRQMATGGGHTPVARLWSSATHGSGVLSRANTRVARHGCGFNFDPGAPRRSPLQTCTYPNRRRRAVGVGCRRARAFRQTLYLAVSLLQCDCLPEGSRTPNIYIPILIFPCSSPNNIPLSSPLSRTLAFQNLEPSWNRSPQSSYEPRTFFELFVAGLAAGPCLPNW